MFEICQVINFFELPWSIFLTFEGLLVILILREAVLTFRLHPHHPERGMAWFNGLVLATLFIAVFAGASALYLREIRIAALLPIYPGARYAPERELFAHDESNIFVTYDATDVITRYYQHIASSSGLVVTIHDDRDAKRILFQRDGRNFFLTVVNTGDSRLLFYSKQGEVTISVVPAH